MSEYEPNVDLEKANVRVKVSQYNGDLRMDARHVWQRDGEWLPTKKGVNILLEDTPALVAAICEAYEQETGVSLIEQLKS